MAMITDKENHINTNGQDQKIVVLQQRIIVFQVNLLNKE